MVLDAYSIIMITLLIVSTLAAARVVYDKHINEAIIWIISVIAILIHVLGLRWALSMGTLDVNSPSLALIVMYILWEIISFAMIVFCLIERNW